MSKWEWLGDVAPYLPPAFGSLVGLRWTKDQTAPQRVLSFITGFGLAVWIGPAIAEVLGLGPKATVAVGILTAILGMDAIGGLIAVTSAFRTDPVGTFRAWWNAWRGQT